jgi:Flp pilus assembly pilin Flp
MFSVIRGYLNDEQGASATEYAMLIVFIALAVAAGAQTLGGGINHLFTAIGTELAGTSPPPLPPPTP